jgi:hypothetical protein
MSDYPNEQAFLQAIQQKTVTIVDADFTYAPSSSVAALKAPCGGYNFYFESTDALHGECSNNAGQVLHVPKTAPLPEIVSFSANPSSIQTGGTTTLSWDVTGVDVSDCSLWDSEDNYSMNDTTGSIESRALIENETFHIYCENSCNDSDEASATVTVISVSAPTLTLTATPGSVVSGDATTLKWTPTNATSCTASGDWSGGKDATNGTHSESTGPLTANKTYSMTCMGAGGDVTKSVTVSVTAAPNPAPTLTFYASPTAILEGDASMLSWWTTDATSCEASGDWTGVRDTSGAESTGVLTAGKTYTLTCAGSGGSVTKTVSVSVYGVPSLSLVATPIVVARGASSLLTWTTANVSSCTASGDWLGSKSATGGNEAQTNIQNDETYTISCLDLGGETITANATVRLSACSDGMDNDGDGKIDMADLGCADTSDNDETDIVTQCSDGIDNDGDGLGDLADPDCTDASDDTESGSIGSGGTVYACSDGIDNDGDGKTDMADPGCSSTTDNNEYNIGSIDFSEF